MPTEYASLFHQDEAVQVPGVRYTRMAPRADGACELEFVAIDTVETDGPPVADKPSQILDQWRAAERAVEAGDGDGASDSADGLRQLYQYSFTEKSRKHAGELEQISGAREPLQCVREVPGPLDDARAVVGAARARAAAVVALDRPHRQHAMPFARAKSSSCWASARS